MPRLVTTPDAPGRFPGAARTAPARERILRAAFDLFYAHGIRAVGVDTVIAESGVAKATLYHHFPAKDALVVAYLDRVDEVWRAQLRRAAEAAGPDPARQLVGLFDALTTACRRPGYRGCAFINAAAEAPADGPVHARTVRHKDEVRAWVRDLAAAAGADDPDLLARQLTVLLDGALSAGALAGGAQAAAAAREAAQALVSAAVTAPGTPPVTVPAAARRRGRPARAGG